MLVFSITTSKNNHEAQQCWNCSEWSIGVRMFPAHLSGETHGAHVVCEHGCISSRKAWTSLHPCQWHERFLLPRFSPRPGIRPFLVFTVPMDVKWYLTPVLFLLFLVSSSAPSYTCQVSGLPFFEVPIFNICSFLWSPFPLWLTGGIYILKILIACWCSSVCYPYLQCRQQRHGLHSIVE